MTISVYLDVNEKSVERDKTFPARIEEGFRNYLKMAEYSHLQFARQILQFQTNSRRGGKYVSI